MKGWCLQLLLSHVLPTCLHSCSNVGGLATLRGKTGSFIEPTSDGLQPKCDALVISSFLLLVAMPFVTSSFLFLVARPGATSSFLLLIAMPFVTSSFLFLVEGQELLVASCS